MKRAGGKNSWALFLLMLAGIVLGGFIGTLTADMPGFAWLNYGQSFGFDNPIVLNLGILVIIKLFKKIILRFHYFKESDYIN